MSMRLNESHTSALKKSQPMVTAEEAFAETYGRSPTHKHASALTQGASVHWQVLARRNKNKRESGRSSSDAVTRRCKCGNHILQHTSQVVTRKLSCWEHIVKGGAEGPLSAKGMKQQQQSR